MKTEKKYIQKFIENVAVKDYKKANIALREVIHNKIKRKIINNNINIF